MSNPEVAALLHLDFTFVSRLRTGQRQPSITTLAKVREIFGWSIDEQVDAILADDYHIQFESQIDTYAATHQEKANV